MARNVIVAACGVLLAATGPAMAQVGGTAALDIKTDLAQAQTTPEPAPKATEPDRWFLMDLLKNTWLGKSLESSGTQIYGWMQHGFAGNPDSPRDRVNFGTNLDWRSNDFRLNQVYFIVENTLEHEDKFNLGYRVDFLAGHDAP